MRRLTLTLTLTITLALALALALTLAVALTLTLPLTLTALEAAVPALRAPRRRWLLEGIADTGVRASVETAICTQATEG